MEDFKSIMKVVGYLIWGMVCFYVIFFELQPDEEKVVENTLEDCVPLQYDFNPHCSKVKV